MSNVTFAIRRGDVIIKAAMADVEGLAHHGCQASDGAAGGNTTVPTRT